jgi:hypothetical protein
VKKVQRETRKRIALTGIGGERQKEQIHLELEHTVTRPYAGFRHPDRMAPDSSVRGGENDCSI